MSSKQFIIATMIAPVNIAVIKYWGKRQEELILPLNDSVSGTLSVDVMCAKTTVYASPVLRESRIWLNGVEESIDNPRLRTCLNEIRKRAAEEAGESAAHLWHVHICSENNFPTAAGLASSAAGYACLVVSLAKLFGLKSDVSGLARLGSGSACRSVYGGFVRWHTGTKTDGSDSIATQIVTEDHWPEMRVLILVVSDQRKTTSSTNGMRDSVATSELLKYRVEKCVPERTARIVAAIRKRDFETFAEVTMKDSNQFHAVCLDTYPPCKYMNDTSHAIVRLIHQYNEVRGLKVAYTFDAGPNACLYLLKPQVHEVLSLINYAFNIDSDVRGIPIEIGQIPDDLKIEFEPLRQERGLIKYVIHTKVGGGPKETKEHLLNEAGLPHCT